MDSFAVQLNTFTKYSLVVEFWNQGGPMATKLWWSYAGQPQIQIPDSAYSSIRYTASSPISLNVIPLWGNGAKNLYEECDDGNSQNYDGCSSNWIIEANYTWTGGTLTSADVCTSTLLSSETISNFSRTSSLITTGLIVAILLINTIAVLTSGYSSGSMFTMINQIQLIMLLPMLPNFMNEDVRVFIVSLNFWLFNFKFIGFDPKDISIGLQLDYEQPDKYLSEIKISSGSGIINILSNLCGVALMILLQIWLLIWSYLLKKLKVDNWFSKFINKAYANMTFGWYIQYISWKHDWSRY